MASIYLATDTVLKRDVAVKMVHPHLLQQPATLKRFSNEAQAIAALSHEHVIKIFDFGESHSRPFIVMEFIDGLTLAELIEQNAPLPNLVTLSIAKQVLDGLICAHKHGIYHRDIKPGNILIDRNGSVRITDFGIAYLVNAESVTLTGSFIGSPHYISPEQITNTTIQSNTDIFSLGIVLYQCLTGTLPFDAESPHGIMHKILNSEAPPSTVTNPQLLFWLADLTETCLIKDAALRPDAVKVLSIIESTCRKDSLTFDQKRIAAFIKNSKEAYASERDDLFDHYKSRAHVMLQGRRQVAGLRCLEQAAAFGPLSTDDQKLLNRMARPIVRRMLLTGSGLLFGAGVILILLLYVLRNHYVQPIEPSEEGEAIDTAGVNVITAARIFDSTRIQRQNVPDTIVIRDTLHSVIATKNPNISAVTISTNLSHQPHSLADSSEDTLQVPSSEEAADPGIGFLRCFTNPPWVTIYIDNIRRGTTPTISVIPLSTGNHVVHLTKKQFNDVYDTITITSAETTSVRIRLTSLSTDTQQ